jgi:hypothetical protein
VFVKSRGLNFDVTRNYRSQRTDPGPFGYCWTWSHGERLIIHPFEVVDIITPTVTLTTYKNLICTDVVQYAHSAEYNNGSWENPNGIVGEPDAWVGWERSAYNFDSRPEDVLVGCGWGFTGSCRNGQAREYVDQWLRQPREVNQFDRRRRQHYTIRVRRCRKSDHGD